jgi:cytochrome P450
LTQSLTGLPGHGTREVPDYPMARDARCPLDPAPGLTLLQAEAPLVKVRLWDGSTHWLVTRYAEQRALLADPRVSADVTHPGFPHASEAFRERTSVFRSFITMDDPGHSRLRQMVIPPFAAARVEAMRPAIQRIVDDQIDALLAGQKPADLVERFAMPVPSLVICRLLGVPYEDHGLFQRSSRMLMSWDTPPRQAEGVLDILQNYLGNLVAKKLWAPGDDLLSQLAVDRVQTGELTQQELATLGIMLLVAGHETTANMIALGTLALLLHPGQLAALRESGDQQAVAAAVEELLRYLSVVQGGRRRVALADIEAGGCVISAGEGLIMPTEVANRDEAVFSDAARLDLHRDAGGHLAFGFGVHECLGQTLARVQLQVVYGTLYRRIPSLALATGVADIAFKHDGLVYGVCELPVTW